MIEAQTYINRYISIQHGKTPDLFSALLYLLYTFTDYSSYMRPICYSLTFYPIDFQEVSNPFHS